MKSFNRFLGITAGVLVIALIISISIIGIYITSHEKELSDYKDFNIQIDDLSGITFFSNNRSSRYDKQIDEQISEFELTDNITIDTSFEEIIFIEESRDNILVEYYKERPDTHLYSSNYSAEQNGDTLFITSSTSIRNLVLDSNYDSYIKIHVPIDYTFNTLDISSSIGKLTNDSILDSVNNLIIEASMGDIDISILSEKNTLSLIGSMGDIDVTLEAPVEKLDISCSMGSINVDINDTVDSLWSSADMGSVELSASQPINNVSLFADLGSIQGIFEGHVNTMRATSDLGSIEIDLYDNDDSTAYVNADLGSIDCDLPIVKKESNPDFTFTTSLGNVNVDLK